MTWHEQMIPGMVAFGVLLLGLRCQGLRWLPRMLWTLAISSVYAFIFFQVTHVTYVTTSNAFIFFQVTTRPQWGAGGVTAGPRLRTITCVQ